jgi:hypothetical protein
MAYRFKRKERVGKGIRRILREQLRRAIETAGDVGGASQDERVHDVRTRLKRSRAAIRLIGGEIGKSARKTDRKLRNRGRRLARPRDNAVQAHTFRILGTRLSRELPPGLLERMRDVGEQLARDIDAKSVEKELRRTARALRRVRRRLGRWRVGRGRRAIGKGVTVADRGSAVLRFVPEHGGLLPVPGRGDAGRGRDDGHGGGAGNGRHFG